MMRLSKWAISLASKRSFYMPHSYTYIQPYYFSQKNFRPGEEKKINKKSSKQKNLHNKMSASKPISDNSNERKEPNVFQSAWAFGEDVLAKLWIELANKKVQANDLEGAFAYYQKAEKIFLNQQYPSTEFFNFVSIFAAFCTQNLRSSHALPILKRAFELLKTLEETNQNDLAAVCTFIGQSYVMEQNDEKALYWFKRPLNELDIGFIDLYNLMTIYYELGFLYQRQGDFEKAKHYLSEYLSQVEDKDTMEYCIVLQEVARINQLKGNLEEAEACLLKALGIAVKQVGEDDYETGLIYNELGHIYLKRRMYKEALEFYETCQRIIKQSGGEDSRDMMILDGNAAEALYMLGRFDEARIYNEDALRIEEKLQLEISNESVANNSRMGFILHWQGDPQALGYVVKAYELATQIPGNNNILILQCLGKLGMIYHMSGDYAKAKECYSKAIERAKETENPVGPEFSFLYFNMGNLCADLEHWKEALEYHEIAYEASQNDGDPYMTNDINLSIGLCKQRLGRPKEAIEHYRNYIDNLMEMKIPNRLAYMNCLKLLTELHIENNGMEKAKEAINRVEEFFKEMNVPTDSQADSILLDIKSKLSE